MHNSKWILPVCFLLFLPTLQVVGNNEKSQVLGIGANQYDSAYRYNVQGWIYTHIEGEPYERGYQHGYLLADEIVDMLTRWSHTIHKHPKLQRITTRLSEDRYHQVAERWWEFCKDTAYRWYWDKYPDEYKDEIRGIADGATARGKTLFSSPITFKDILAMNQMYELMSKFSRLRMGFHPLRTFFYQLQLGFPAFSELPINDLVGDFFPPEEAHHCNGFIATGNATTNGQMIITHSTICGGSTWWWNYYISLRWNVILDILPAEGYRVIISTSPGLIWSDEDYYQNGNGIVFLETTVPQGLFDFKGLPLSVRARTAVQYAENIDDVIHYLRYRNDGSMNAVWNIGDAKTGEIARLDLGWRAYEVWRTFDGYYWSANNPFNFRVRLEKLNIKQLLKYRIFDLVGSPGLGYYSLFYKPVLRDLKYEELGDKYYGRIDTDIVKEITMTSPISDWITDIKLTNTELLQHNGLWAFFGNPYRALNYTSFDTKEFTARQVYPAGWVRIYSIDEKADFELETKQASLPNNVEQLWSYNTTDTQNYFSIRSTYDEDNFYTITSTGRLLAINKTEGRILWNQNDLLPTTQPTLQDNLLVVGQTTGVTAYDTSGKILWENSELGTSISPPVILGNSVYVSNDQGAVYALSKATGMIQWSLSFTGTPYLSSYGDETLLVSNATSCSAVDVNSKQILWTYATNGPITISCLSDETTVYGGSWDTTFFALNGSSGDLLWSHKLGWGFDTVPCMNEEMIFVPCMDTNVYALNKTTGDIAWIFSANAGFHSEPTVFGEYVFVGSDDGRVYALNQTTGIAVWLFTPRFSISDIYTYDTTPILSDTAVSDGIVLTAANGVLYGLDAQTVASAENKNDDESSDTADDEKQQDDASEDTSDPSGKESEGINFGLLVLVGGVIFLIFLVLFVILYRRREFM